MKRLRDQTCPSEDEELLLALVQPVEALPDSEERQRSLDSTCRKLHRFLSRPPR